MMGQCPLQGISSKHKGAKEYLDMRSGAPGAVRMGCIVGGACGMAMIIDSPLGGILYMFPWPGNPPLVGKIVELNAPHNVRPLPRVPEGSRG